MTETNLAELLESSKKAREGSILEIIDYAFAKNLGLDITKLPIPRIMGLLRQLRIDAEELERATKK